MSRKIKHKECGDCNTLYAIFEMCPLCHPPAGNFAYMMKGISIRGTVVHDADINTSCRFSCHTICKEIIYLPKETVTGCSFCGIPSIARKVNPAVVYSVAERKQARDLPSVEDVAEFLLQKVKV